jgi:hypothetical protein
MLDQGRDLARNKGRDFRSGTVTKAGPTKRRSASRAARAKAPSSSGWQRQALARVRRLIREADPEAVEEQKWKKPSNPAGVPVWSHGGIICTGETYQNHVRLTFAEGVSLDDPDRLFNSGFAGHTVRAIVLHEGDRLDEEAFKSLVRRAAARSSSAHR